MTPIATDAARARQTAPCCRGDKGRSSMKVILKDIKAPAIILRLIGRQCSTCKARRQTPENVATNQRRAWQAIARFRFTPVAYATRSSGER